MARAGGGGRPPHGISRLARLAQPLPLWRVAPAFPHLVVLMVDAGTPPELPPGLREEYLAGMRAQLGLLATIADRLTAAGNDREALAVLQRETHKIHGSAGSYGFAEASRLAAGLEATDHTSELQSPCNLVCRLLLEKKKKKNKKTPISHTKHTSSHPDD